GFTVGATAGYNWQFAPHWLVGLEEDVGYLGLNNTIMEWNDPAAVGVQTDWYATLRARFGYVTGPSLLYVTGGAALVHSRNSFGGPATAGPTTNNVVHATWTAGGGIETKLSRSWSAKTEYLYIQGNTTTFLSNVLGGPFGTTFDQSFHVIKTGLNYKIGE